jgi:uncharacterized protein YndB with AHSA1/START domain
MPVPQPAAVIDRDAFTFRMEREFNHPRELVFRAWSSCEHVTHWWGPKEFTLPVCEMDFRPGGTWFYGMFHPDFGLNHGLMAYQTIVEPELIEFVDHFVDANRTINPDLPAGRGRLDFIDLGGGRTRLVNASSYQSLEQLDQVVAMGMEQGFSMTLDRLEEHLLVMKG